MKNLLKLKISNSDTKVMINSYNKIVYPDAVVICEVPEYFEDRNDTITNPLIVVEISSPSTSKHDRTTKFEMYATIPSFKEYVLIDQDIQRVSVWSKQKDGSWMPKMYLGEDSVIILEAMNNCPISLKDLY
jgi:Uma2 family endonuclease